MTTKGYSSVLIVESPTKVKTLKRYVGRDVLVEASVGHIKDLPKSRLGVDTEHDFEPEYVTIKGKDKIIKKLTEVARNVDTIYLASDPDREGEAIAFHVADEILKEMPSSNIKRILFYEITRQGVVNAFSNPSKLNEMLFFAHKARRVLDRLVGYKISPLLWEKVRYGLSAGRVQSVALRLLVDRERAIKAFVPKEWFTLEALLKKEGTEFHAELMEYEKRKAHFKDDSLAKKVLHHLSGLPLVVKNVQHTERRRSPKPPFITSTLQQAAAANFGFDAKETMVLAQRLYEGIDIPGIGQTGLITYMRTDSTRLSLDMCKLARDFVKDYFGMDYIASSIKEYESSKRVQDAHEAIRPTELNITPENLEGKIAKKLLKLYSLIFWRFMSSQMKEARFLQTVVLLETEKAIFKAKGEITLHLGFLKALEINELAYSDMESIPMLEVGEKMNPEKLEIKKHTTKPPSRYTEASLIKELEEKAIGRPSTYASIVSTILDRKYIEKQNSNFLPSQLGIIINDLLVSHFPNLLDIDFTAKLEKELDLVEDGLVDWHTLIKDFYLSLNTELMKAKEFMPSMKEFRQKTDILCDICNAPTEVRFGKRGYFLSCTRFPECTFAKPCTLRRDGSIEIVNDDSYQLTDKKCPKCQALMLVKFGRFGKFLACSRYPECKGILPFSTGIKCPLGECEGELVQRLSKKGRRFYGCSNYPRCTVVFFDEPVSISCQQCGFKVLVKKMRSKQEILQCPSCKATYEKDTVQY